jgi:hypothetical protein
MCAVAEKPGDHMVYVKLLLELSVMERLEQSGGAYVAAFDKGPAQALISKAHNPQYKPALLARIEKLEKKLGIAERWLPNSHEFQVQIVHTSFALFCLLSCVNCWLVLMNNNMSQCGHLLVVLACHSGRCMSQV